MEELFGTNNPIRVQSELLNVRATGEHGKTVNLRAKLGIPYTPTPLVEDGVFFFLAFEITGSDLTTYSSSLGAGSAGFVDYYGNIYPNQYSTFNEKIQYTKNDTGDSNRYNTEIYNNYSLKYATIGGSNVYIYENFSTLKDLPDDSPITFIFWVRNPQNMSNGDEYFRNSNSTTNPTELYKDGNDLVWGVPSTYVGSKPFIKDYFSNSFAIDISDWHMITTRIAEISGSGHGIDITVSGKYNVKYKFPDDTSDGTFYDQTETNFKFFSNADVYFQGSSNDYSIDVSMLLYYSRSISDNEIDQVFKHFAPSHGLVKGL